MSRAIENAQRKVEGRNFDIRKQLLEYDDVANDQRKVIYEQRNNLMEVDDISDSIASIRGDVVNEVISQSIPPGSLEEQWNSAELEETLQREFGMELPIRRWLEQDNTLDEDKLRARIIQEFDKAHAEKTISVGPQVMRHFEKAVMLQVLDAQWKDHLAAMDHLRQGIHLRGYAQKNPKEEYKREAFQLFSEMLDRIKREVIGIVTRVVIREPEDVAALEAQRPSTRSMQYEHPGVAEQGAAETAAKPMVRGQPKIGRNDPCPCGSGKKYKQCHGKLA